MTRRRLILAAAGLILAACGSKPEPACPEALIVKDLATVTKFRDGPGRDLTDIVVEGEIFQILAQCKYDRGGVNVDLQVALGASRGPADRASAAALEYFVAIVGPAGNIVAKERFDVRFAFAANQGRVAQVEEIEQRIPLTNLQTAVQYGILVGFQLTENEIEWNRQRSR